MCLQFYARCPSCGSFVDDQYDPRRFFPCKARKDDECPKVFSGHEYLYGSELSRFVCWSPSCVMSVRFRADYHNDIKSAITEMRAICDGQESAHADDLGPFDQVWADGLPPVVCDYADSEDDDSDEQEENSRGELTDAGDDQEFNMVEAPDTPNNKGTGRSRFSTRQLVDRLGNPHEPGEDDLVVAWGFKPGRRVHDKKVWTNEESALLLSRRSQGYSFQDIQKWIPKHTVKACRRMHRVLDKKRMEQEAARAPSLPDDVDSGSDSESEEDFSSREATSEAVDEEIAEAEAPQQRIRAESPDVILTAEDQEKHDRLARAKAKIYAKVERETAALLEKQNPGQLHDSEHEQDPELLVRDTNHAAQVDDAQDAQINQQDENRPTPAMGQTEVQKDDGRPDLNRTIPEAGQTNVRKVDDQADQVHDHHEPEHDNQSTEDLVVNEQIAGQVVEQVVEEAVDISQPSVEESHDTTMLDIDDVVAAESASEHRGAAYPNEDPQEHEQAQEQTDLPAVEADNVLQPTDATQKQSKRKRGQDEENNETSHAINEPLQKKQKQGEGQQRSEDQVVEAQDQVVLPSVEVPEAEETEWIEEQQAKAPQDQQPPARTPSASAGPSNRSLIITLRVPAHTELPSASVVTQRVTRSRSKTAAPSAAGPSSRPALNGIPENDEERGAAEEDTQKVMPRRSTRARTAPNEKPSTATKDVVENGVQKPKQVAKGRKAPVKKPKSRTKTTAGKPKAAKTTSKAAVNTEPDDKVTRPTRTSARTRSQK